MNKKQLGNFLLALVLVMSSCLLGACAEREQAREKIIKIQDEANEALKRVQRIDRRVSSLVVENDRPWFGQSAVRFQNGDPLPEQLIVEDALVITFERPLTLMEVAARIQATTGIRVIVEQGQTPEDVAGNSALFLPVDGNEVPGGRILWQGSLTNLLDQLSDRFDAEWLYTNQAIRISRHVVRTFMLHALAGDLTLSGTIASGSGEGTSGLPQQSIGTSTNISIWQEINDAVTNIVGERGSATFSPGTGTVTVAGSPSSIHDVEQYLRIQNRLRLRRVAVEVRVLSISLDRSNSFNFNLDAIIEDAVNGQPFSYSSNRSGNDSRSLSAGIVTAVPAGLEGNKINAIIDGLSAVASDISVVHSGTLVTMSDQPAPLQVATKRSYVKSVQGAATDGATSTTIEPDVIDIGMSMNILPRVITQDKVMLRLAIGITDLVELREFESSGATVQLPEIESTGFLQNAILNSGETLVMAGFERNTANDTQVGTGVPWNMIPGGQFEYQNRREARVLLITAEVLPEEKMETISSH